jgi:Ala-tRNA(Pro) deacylase
MEVMEMDVVATTAVRDWLEREGVRFEVVPHTQTYTSIEEARALGISADEVVKAVLVHTRTGYALLAVPGARRLDMHRVRDVVGDGHARLATEEELARTYPMYELGALPPVGAVLGIPLFVDAAVFQNETVVFAAGTRTESVRVRAEDVFWRERSASIPLTRTPGEEEWSDKD